jgi:hypothetical protein
VNTAITAFYYSWTNATSASASGLPAGVSATVDASAQTITISGTPTEAGTFNFTVTTVGGSSNASLSGIITVEDVSSISKIAINENETGFCSVDGTIDNNFSGYEGDGFANTNNAKGAGIEWSISVPSSGDYIFRWKYALAGNKNRPGAVLIDGTSKSSASFIPTGNNNIWVVNSSSQVTVNLSAGTHTIRLEATTAGGLGNIDKMEVEGVNPQVASCGNSSKQVSSMKTPNLTVNDAENEVKIYPVPFKNEFYIDLAKAGKVKQISVYNALGQQIRLIDASEITNKTTKVNINTGSGMYVIKIITENGVINKTIIKK